MSKFRPDREFAEVIKAKCGGKSLTLQWVHWALTASVLTVTTILRKTLAEMGSETWLCFDPRLHSQGSLKNVNYVCVKQL